LHAIECFHAAHAVSKASVLATHRPRLAYVSPLPPEKSGIADYSAELLQVLTRHYQVEVIVVQQEITDAYILANCKVRSLKWLRTHVGSYDRVLYHFGNSSFHEHMFDLLETVPGVVVLHDFFLSSIQAYREALGLKPNAWAHALADSHGLLSVQQRFTAADTTDVISTYPCNLSVLQHAFGIIVHSQETRRLARKWFGTSVGDDWALIPHLRTPVLKGDRTSSRKTLGLALDKFIVCAFGLLGRHKLNHRLLESWLASPLAQDESAQLVFVGENDGGDYGADLVRTIKSARIASQILITGWADDKNYRLWLAAADIGVQLRAHSRGETSGAVLDCMNNGLAVIVNSHGSMADLDPDAAWKLPDEFRNEELAHALTTLRSDPARCAELGRHAREIVRRRHAPGACAEHYAQAIERFYVRAQAGLPGIVKHLANDVSLITPLLATALARNFPPKPRRLQLLVDISVLVQCDARSGIQRVVRSILHEWLTQPPGGYQVEAVYATSGKPGYRYARRFCSRFLGITDAWALDATVEAWSGDSFVGLDLQPNLTPAHLESLHEWRRRGVKVSFVVYDLLPVLLPQAFPDGTPSIHQRWLQVITQFDGIFCISKTVALELGRWLTTFGARRDRPLQIDWFHLGANIGQSERTKGLPNNAENILSVMRSRPTFLMVGTIEPRKRHAQSLAAFELLWKKELDANLVIVGKEGWGVGSFVSKLRKHAENNVRLFWLDGVSDEYLGKIYAASDCLLANSKGEGFGLPLIEAAQHKLPIIARDIPVFHEVAADRAFYFSDSDDPSILATAIIDWSNLHAEGRHPRSDAIAWQTWHESANQLLEVVLGKH
jgi:glycosyltransferase involved in cell wall biosynthesis